MVTTVAANAPELDVVHWFNTKRQLTIAGERGKVVVLHAFQMLCPGCVREGTPLAQRLHDHLAGSDVTVIGLHTVFEHHDAMTPVSLAAYLTEFGITMPVAVDRHDQERVPVTMSAYAMRGTPTLIIIDRSGRIRHHMFGAVDPIWATHSITTLVGEASEPNALTAGCDDGHCTIR